MVRKALTDRLERTMRRKAQFQNKTDRNEVFAQNAKKANQAETLRRKAAQVSFICDIDIISFALVFFFFLLLAIQII